MRTEASYKSLFFNLLLLTAFFLCLEISFFITENKAYFADFTHVANELTVPKRAMTAILAFIFIQLSLHFLYTLCIWVLTILNSKFLARYISSSSPSSKFILKLGIATWLIGLTTIFLLNFHWYPNSKFSELIAVIFFTPILIKLGLYFFLALSSVVIMIAIIGLFYQFKSLHSWQQFMMCVLLIVISVCLTQKKPIVTTNPATGAQPNIIIIGIDALRPDFLAYFGHDKQAPFLDEFLNHATVFSDALTPLARTFPSWTSILTGQYPIKSGVRFNLANPEHLHLTDTLPAILKKHHYITAYASDETRFSNIDHYYGFDEIITAPMGLNDFIIGTFNDFPISNLLVNTKLGQWLFPYSYGNRGVYFTYDPQSFLERLTPFLQTPKEHPLFLCVHFCLTHFPNVWAGSHTDGLLPAEVYQASVDAVGKQIEGFFNLLKQNKLLEHAIVVVLSDHGEGLALAGDRITEKELYFDKNNNKNFLVPHFYPPSMDNEDVNQSAGHGTDVLGLPQYHVLLSFKFFGFKQQTIASVPALVTLLDIKPTILELLDIGDGVGHQTDGVSLAGFLTSEKKVHDHPAHIFIESDYSPESIRTVYPEVRHVMLDGIKLFSIDPVTTRLIIKDQMGKMILTSKQYADLYGEWVLAYYPQNKTLRTPILVNLRTGEWTDHLDSNLAKHSPAIMMMHALKSFYSQELSTI